MYDFTYMDREDADIEMGDGTRIIFLIVKDTEGNISEEIKSFLSYANGIEVNDPLCNTIDVSVQNLKLNDDIRGAYMLLVDKIADERREARAEGITLGRTEGAADKEKELILKHHKNGKSPQEIADILFMTQEEVNKIIDAEKAKN